MEVLKNLKERIEKNLEPLSEKADMTPSELDTATKAVCLIEKIDKIMSGDYEYSDGPHRAYYPHHDYSYGWYDPYMHDGYSGMRGRDAATGRYVSRGYDPEWDRNYEHDRHTSGRRSRMSVSYDGDYSRHSIDDRIVDMLEKMMDSATSDYERRKLNSVIRVVDSMRGE